jgi:putative (di)nucleoside polyphosphate hydrolase
VSSAFFRANAGACICDHAGMVLACQRREAKDGAWQMPQGGLELNERPEQALWRELGEELGLCAQDLVLEREHPEWIAYELPEAYRSAKVGMGQVQKWFLLRARSEMFIKLDGREFDRWRWLEPELLLQVAVSFRKVSYSKILSAFNLLSRDGSGMSEPG